MMFMKLMLLPCIKSLKSMTTAKTKPEYENISKKKKIYEKKALLCIYVHRFKSTLPF